MLVVALSTATVVVPLSIALLLMIIRPSMVISLEYLGRDYW